MNTLEKLSSRYKGTILGAAIGDALGMPTEYISREQLDRDYQGRVIKFERASSLHPCGHLQAGQYTDDTQQLILLAESLLAKKGFSEDDFAQRMGVWADQCRNVPGFNRFGGGTSLTAGLRIFEGIKKPQGMISPATCGSAMRIAPIGLFYRTDKDALREAARASSRVTHNHPLCQDAATYIANLVGSLADDQEPYLSALETKQLLTPSLLTEKIDYILSHYQEQPERVVLTVGLSEKVDETVPMALYCFLHSPDNYEETVLNAANLVPGDTDSIACIAGALSGAYNSCGKIPPRFMENLENKRYLEILATKLWEHSTHTIVS